MNPDSTIEYNSLSWVKAQLDDVLSDAQNSLNEYIENNTDGELENCIEHLQLIYGTLQMVEVYGASMLAEEMQLTTAALLAGDIEREEDAYDVLMRAMLQLPDYLEAIQAGKKDAPITLMPLFNDLRAARNEGLLSESVLFSPDLEKADLKSSIDDIEPGNLQGEVKRLRTHYQLGLLDFIRNNKERVGLQRIKAVLNSLEKVSNNDEVRHVWMITAALAEGLIKEGIDSNLSIKMLLGSVDRQLKTILDNGEEEFSSNYSKELVKNALYYVGLSTVDTKSIAAVKDAYNLAELIPQDTDDSAAIGGLNADLFDTVSKGITEDLEKVKDVLELIMHSNERDNAQLEPVAAQLGKIADTYGMLGMGATRQAIMDQRVVIEGIVTGDVEISDQIVLDIASELLNAESELKDYIDSRSGFVDMNHGKGESAVPAAEYRQVVHTVVAEGLKNFSVAKEAVLSYVSGIGDKEQLDIILNRLEEVRGVAMMLPLGRVESQIEKLQNFISVALVDHSHQASDEEQDTIADVVTSIEYYFEALSEGRPGVEQGLNAGDAAVLKLESIIQSYEGEDKPVESFIEAPIEEPIEELAEELAEDAEAAPEEAAEVLEEVVVEDDARKEVVGQDLGDHHEDMQYSILADDADEEIVEIFIEEAVEVLGELHEYLPQWKNNNEDEEALAVVRRSFHTLKGSGRLLGAEMIGEFSWKFENVLNRIIENKITVSESLFGALDEALAVLPQLIEQLKGNREPIDNIEQLMSDADAIAEGKEISPVENKGSAIEELEVVAADVIADNDLSEVDVTDELDNLETIEVLDVDLSEGETTIEEIDVDLLEGETTIEEIDVDDVTSDLPEEIELNPPVDEVISITDELEVLDESVENISEIDTFGSDDAEPDAGVDDVNVIDISIANDDSNLDEFEIVIDEDVVNVANETLDIDPMLLKIYHDESQGYVEIIRRLIDESEASHLPLKAGKDLIRAFHTLYGSARTAEVDAIADLSGSAEKYVKIRQESSKEDIPDDVVSIFKEMEKSISGMLDNVADGNLPAGNKALQDKINKIVQQEIQDQLQQSWQDHTPGDDVVKVEAVATDDFDVASIDDEFSVDIADLSPDIDDNGVELVDVSTTDIEKVTHKEAAPEENVVMSYGDIDDELIDIFLEEADELLENCEVTISEIVKSPDSEEHIQQLQRNMHTLKGGARMADLSPVGDLTHILESLIAMVSEKKVTADKALFDLLQESLDALTNMLASVKKREALTTANDLNNRIEMLMRGEVAEKRSVERFDIDLSELESADDDELEDIDISNFLPSDESKTPGSNDSDVKATEVPSEQQENTDGRPHWGERASDVNFKDTQEQVRVRSDLLNNLVNYAGEVNIYHARMGKQIGDFSFNLSELTQTVVRLKEQLRNLEIETEIQIRSGYETESDNYDAGFDPLEMDQYSTLQQLTRSLSETAGDVDSINEILTEITRSSETLLLQESRVSTDLQEGLMRTRMVRFGGLSSRLRRIARQIARELGKEVELNIEGEGSEVDRTVLDRIIAPLEHMIRNAVAHGIESPEQRALLGKSEAGKINIVVDRQGTNVIINVKDDGAGIDANKVREKAVKQGLITYDTELSDHDALQFILQSGFSTADEVTQVAGRGVGMDVVDSEIKQLGGVLDISTVRGQGTTFNVRLPLTLAINQALLVSAGEDVYAVPLASIEGVVRMTGYELQRFYDSDNSHYEFNNVEFELKHLGGLLTGHQPDYSKQLQLFPVLLVRVGDKHFALHVDDMLGRREIVVKPVGMQIGSVRGIAGATILADGRVVLILEMSALVAAESLFKPHTPIEITEIESKDDDKKTIMVVDDSITIRKITERMLKRYGIEVVLAKDGIDATSQLQDNIPDLMLLDIEMPRMDGFEVASFVRNDERLKDIPIIMITSRTGAKHKEKAMEIGVNQYLGKPFQEDDLVNNINEILNTAF